MKIFWLNVVLVAAADLTLVALLLEPVGIPAGAAAFLAATGWISLVAAYRCAGPGE